MAQGSFHITERKKNRMEKSEHSTLDRIHKAAMEEFTANGYRSASLRTIVKKAGVTTGTFYDYYDSKEALFEALLGDRADEFTEWCRESEYSTLGRIRKAAFEEFTQKGFRGASLRSIVKLAGVTTGAFYGYYSSKEALFDEMVGREYREFIRNYRESIGVFASLSPQEKCDQMVERVLTRSEWMIEYIYSHMPAFKLLVCSAAGTKYEGFLDELVRIKIAAGLSFVDSVHSIGIATIPIDPELEHLLCSGLFSSFFELVTHDIPQENANHYIHQLQKFYIAGWRKIIGI